MGSGKFQPELEGTEYSPDPDGAEDPDQALFCQRNRRQQR